MASLLDGLPADAAPVGYVRLVGDLGLRCPVRSRSAVSAGNVKNHSRTVGDWTLVDRRHAVGDKPVDHLDYAVRRERMDPLALKKAFLAIPAKDVAAYVETSPLGRTQRRTWFLYEWLTGDALDVRDLKTGNYIDALDPELYHVADVGSASTRHRVRDNMPGTRAFCPIMRRTPLLGASHGAAVQGSLAALVGATDANVMRRVAGHLLLADSRSSFLIENETPPQDRLRRWASTIGAAGRADLSFRALDELQHQVLGDRRFVHKGLRTGCVYLGTRDRFDEPVPEFVGARPQDLRDLVGGLIEYDRKMHATPGYDAVAHAAALSFGFVYVHPFEDGNGRVHRYLLHHALARSKFVPPGIVLPVSNVMDRDQDEYGHVLRGHSASLMEFIPWKSTGNGNVEVTEDTSDLYRYPDLTAHGEYLGQCLEATVEVDFPNEITWIRRDDTVKANFAKRIEMPDRKVEDFVAFVRQNDWSLSTRKRTREFALLTDEEVSDLEDIVRDAFDVESSHARTP